MITGGFGMTMNMKTGAIRRWFMDRDGVKRWTDNNEPVDVCGCREGEVARNNTAGGIEMALSYDIARCTGTTAPICMHCRRREPGRDVWQVYMPVPRRAHLGECSYFISPNQTFADNKTSSGRSGTCL